MSLKNFKSRNGIDVDSYTIPSTSFQKALSSNTTTTLDTIAMDSFVSSEYFIETSVFTTFMSSSKLHIKMNILYGRTLTAVQKG